MAVEAAKRGSPEASASVTDRADRDYLSAALEEIRLALERVAATSEQEVAALDLAIGAARLQTAAVEASVSGQSRFHRMVEVFGLSQFERGMVLLCAGLELDPRFSLLCAAAHGWIQGGAQAGAQASPTFALGFSLFAGADWGDGSLGSAAVLAFDRGWSRRIADAEPAPSR